jgi:ABC-type antimicrobial peptide transport system permease subunit
LVPLAIGIAVGAVAAVATGRAMAALLFGSTPFDAAAFAGAALALLLVTLGASLLPARRVATIDPMRALRSD